MIKPESATLGATRAAGRNEQAMWKSATNYRSQSEPAQEGVHCGAIWKSPRDRTRSIEATLREYNGNAYADFRLMQMDASGRMRPTGQRLTVSAKQLGKFSKLVGDTYRRADKLGLTPRSTS